jgi:hypothetical protein
MFGCCTDMRNVCKNFTCEVKETEKGLIITITSDDPKKVEALKTLRASCRELCGEDYCCC